jgi:hypothetical protein
MGRRAVVLCVCSAALGTAVATTATAATTQTFTTAQSPFPSLSGSGAVPNQGTCTSSAGPSQAACLPREPYDVYSARGSQDNFFTFDLRSSCVASAVTLRLVRGSQLYTGGTMGTSDYTFREVTTPAEIVNVPGGYPFSPPPFFEDSQRISQDLRDGPTYGGGPYPIDGSPQDVLSFPLNDAGVRGFNAARGGFFTVGGSGGGHFFVDPTGHLRRNPIFSSVTDPGTLVVTCALPANKDQCKNGGWQSYGVFKNQGDCVSFVATGGKNPPANSP